MRNILKDNPPGFGAGMPFREGISLSVYNMILHGIGIQVYVAGYSNKSGETTHGVYGIWDRISPEAGLIVEGIGGNWT